MSARGADNASVNNNWHHSVFQRLPAANPHSLKGNCKCHVITITVKAAFPSPVLEAVMRRPLCQRCVLNSVELLKDFCEFTNTQHQGTLRHVHTHGGCLCCQQFSGLWTVGRLKCCLMLPKHHIIRVFVYGATDAENVDRTVAECILAVAHNVMQQFLLCVGF